MKCTSTLQLVSGTFVPRTHANTHSRAFPICLWFASDTEGHLLTYIDLSVWAALSGNAASRCPSLCSIVKIGQRSGQSQWKKRTHAIINGLHGQEQKPGLLVYAMFAVGLACLWPYIRHHGCEPTDPHIWEVCGGCERGKTDSVSQSQGL